MLFRSSTSTNYSFQATTNRTLVAHFIPESFIVTVSISPENAGNVSGAGTYNYNETAELLASANEGWKFDKWTINSTEVFENPTAVNVTEDVNAIAFFSIVSDINGPKKESILIYPNPTKGIINIENVNGVISISVIDLIGYCIYETQLFENSIDLNFLPNGIYALKVKYLEQSVTIKLVKQ